ncbi:MAG: hypothetical protein RSA64_03045 [Christensenellaceae bacterium]
MKEPSYVDPNHSLGKKMILCLRCLAQPANTTYSKNTGVLAVTKNYNPATLRMRQYSTSSSAF